MIAFCLFQKEKSSNIPIISFLIQKITNKPLGFTELSLEGINGTQSRTDDSRPDPIVSTGSASLDDYKGSAYDRVHLCPAADMKLNKTSMAETFYLSNISPQWAGSNRGIWSTVEDQDRKWALEFDGLDVATGTIFKDNHGTIGSDKVTVPGYYYKVLYSEKKKIMIGLILPNESGTTPLSQYIVKVASSTLANATWIWNS